MKVLIVYKKSMLELARAHGNTAITPAMEAAHEAHKRAVDSVWCTLDTLGIEWKSCYRASLGRQDTNGKLIITVGGDGTVLDASHKLGNEHVLGVNSDQQRSVGLFCSATPDTFKQVLLDVLEEKLTPTKVARIYGSVDDEPLPFPVLNDILVCDANPAAMSRYEIVSGNVMESQRSSGIWIATPIGSTGAIASAGGYIVPLHHNKVQFRVRELYLSDLGANNMVGEFAEELTIISRMRHGKIFIDGRHQKVSFPAGSVLKVSLGGQPLNLYLTEETKERRSKFVFPNRR